MKNLPLLLLLLCFSFAAYGQSGRYSFFGVGYDGPNGTVRYSYPGQICVDFDDFPAVEGWLYGYNETVGCSPYGEQDWEDQFGEFWTTDQAWAGFSPTFCWDPLTMEASALVSPNFLTTSASMTNTAVNASEELEQDCDPRDFSSQKFSCYDDNSYEDLQCVPPGWPF